MNPAPVATPKKVEEPIKRTLAYEQAISQPRDPSKDDTAQDDTAQDDTAQDESETKDISDFETVTSAAEPQDAGDPPAIEDVPSDDTPQDMAALPPDEEPADGQPEEQGAGQWGTDGAEQWGDEQYRPTPYANRGDDRYAPPQGYDPYAAQNDPYAQPGDPYREDDERYDPNADNQFTSPPQQGAYGPPPSDPSVARRYGDPNGDPYAARRDPYGPPPGDPYAAQRDPYGQQADPYGQGDPYAAQRGDAYGAQPQQPWSTDENGDEWVQVIVSGSPMRGEASEEAPMMFAFPYGRSLKVVSRSEGWVEVTDPKSAATGWMQAHALGPARPPGAAPYGQTEAYYDDQPKERPGIFRRGGIADMINRAFGGGGN